MTAILDASNDVTLPAGRYPIDPSKLIGIAIHHSVTHIAETATEDEERGHIRIIDAYHVQLGFGGFGYHYAAFPSGRVYRTCSTIFGARAHVESRNAELIGVCVIGDFSDPQSVIADAQLVALMEAIAEIGLLTVGLAPAPLALKGHKDWALPASPTACPGSLGNVSAWHDRGLALIAQNPPVTPPTPSAYGVYQVGKQLFVNVEGVNVLRIGSEDGRYPGQIAKLVADRWFWLAGAADAYATGQRAQAYWSVLPQD